MPTKPNDPYASLPDTTVPDKDPYVNMPEASNTGQTAAPPTHTMQATPPFFSVAGMKEHGYRAARAVLDLLPTAGGVVGGLIGGGAGIETGPGALATAAAGATAGGVLGEDAKQIGNQLIFPASSGWTPGPATGKDVAKDLAKEGAIQGLNEVTGRLAGRVVKPAVDYFKDTAAASKVAGVNLLPSEANNGSESYIEKFLKGSVLTSGKMERFRVMQNAQTRQAAEKVAKDLENTYRVRTPEEVGMMVQQGLEQHTAAFRVQQNQMYSDIDAAVQEHVVQTPVQQVTGAGFHQQVKTVMKQTLEGPAMPSMKPLKEFASAELEKLNQQEQVLDPALLSSSRSMLQNIVNAPDKVTFKAMASSRSDMLALTRKLDEALPGKQAGFAKKLASLADGSMMDAADKSGIPGLPDQIRAANKLTADTHAIYEQALIKKVVDTKKPEVISRLIGGNAVGLQETRDLMNILPAGIQPAVQKQVVLDSIRRSTDIQTGMFNEGKFAANIAKMGDDRGNIVFGKNWKNIQELSQLMSKINGPTGLTGGSGAALQNFSVIKNLMLTVAAPLGLASSGKPLAAAGSLAAEWATLNTFASAITNPETSGKVLEGMRKLVKASPYIATGGYEASKGQTKMTQDLKAIRDKHAAQMQPTQ